MSNGGGEVGAKKKIILPVYTAVSPYQSLLLVNRRSVAYFLSRLIELRLRRVGSIHHFPAFIHFFSVQFFFSVV